MSDGKWNNNISKQCPHRNLGAEARNIGDYELARCKGRGGSRHLVTKAGAVTAARG